jgi:hypothetical protein
MENPFDERPRRSAFLGVLCVLTFIGSGCGAYTSLLSLLTYNPEDIVRQVNEVSAQMDHGVAIFAALRSRSMDLLLATAEHWRAIFSLKFLFYVLSFAGAVAMFRCRRRGFFLYAVAQVALLFISPLFAGFQTLVLLGLAFSAVFTFLFIILYAVNLRGMR